MGFSCLARKRRCFQVVSIVQLLEVDANSISVNQAGMSVRAASSGNSMTRSPSGERRKP